MKFLIPSYKRPEKQKTLMYLHELGYTKKDIILSTQTTEDFEKYRHKWGEKAEIILTPGAYNAAGNRNGLLRTLRVGEKAILLDDDIARIDRLVCITSKKHPFGEFAPVKSKDEFESIIAAGFAECQKRNALTWGMYSIHNERMMYGAIKNNGKWSEGKIFIGSFFGIVFTGQMFDERYSTKEDYQYLLSQRKQGYNILRMNAAAPYASHFTKGGCAEVWGSDLNVYSAHLLVHEFPEYVKLNLKKQGEILQRKERSEKDAE